VTRCSSTRYAVTAHFCGHRAADNLDSTRTDDERGIMSTGVAPFIRLLAAIHRNATSHNAPHPTFVYRLGISPTERSDPSQAHVWSIVAQPDGTFMWLQSFINHYSLNKWIRMDLADSRGERYLTLKQLRAKLDRLRWLQNVESWSTAANNVYRELFNVSTTLIGMIPSSLLYYDYPNHA